MGTILHEIWSNLPALIFTICAGVFAIGSFGMAHAERLQRRQPPHDDTNDE